MRDYLNKVYYGPLIMEMENSEWEISWPRKTKKRIYPVFLPFQGCPTRCIFCGQDTQTGLGDADLKKRLPELLAACKDRLGQMTAPREIAFYGGTFTGLEESSWKMCLAFCREMTSQNSLLTFRCSTRPDFLAAARLEELKNAHFQVLELGIQSFDDYSLGLAGRGYDQRVASAACRTIKEMGFRLGVQLMPGMPGSTPEKFINDVRLALELGADCLRFYPCVVIENTGLAKIWRSGRFAPWALDTTLETLARGWLLSRAHNVEVLRMGLAAERALLKALLSGPWHEALGSRVQALATYYFVKERIDILGCKKFDLQLPAWTRGHFYGWKGELAEKWQDAGLGKVEFQDEDVLKIIY